TLSEKNFLAVFEGVPMFEVSRDQIDAQISIVDFLTEQAPVFQSKSEVRRTLKENALSINKSKIDDTFVVSSSSLLNNKYILVQKGKKNYYIIRVNS
ncbi:MAG: tyrosine--tRNA ligase, partial [Bacteroidales bacterium]|nr:tyrosine--tRNA ligase [Bacteroidales bacterium]